MSTTTDLTSMSNIELISMLVGEQAAQCLATRSPSELFKLFPQPLAIHESFSADPKEKIFDAAKELMARALSESMEQRSLLDSPHAVRDYLRLRLADRDHEVFSVLLLDARHQLLAAIELFRGTLTQTCVYPREVVKLALSHNAGAVIFAHNHPSGAKEPSQADIDLTKILQQALSLVDVRTIDHFIVAGMEKPLSLAEKGLI